MEINAPVASRETYPIPPGRDAIAHPASQDGKVAKVKQPDADPQVITANDVEIVSTDDTDGEKVKGVLRLLQEGHFRGVADVRLRINFHDEISAIQAEKTGQATEDGVEDITETLQAELTAFLEANPPEEELAALIDEASETMFASFESLAQVDASENSLQTSDVISGLQAAFDEFVSSINLGSETGSPEDSPDVAGSELIAETLSNSDETGESSTTQEAFDLLIADLTETFSSKLSNIESMLNDMSVLPDLSEPSGNGKAYNKFLAIYNDLYSRAEDSPPPEQVDAVA